MANQIRIKRRASGGAAGAPAALKNAELAFNEADLTLYYGFGDDGSGNATSVIGIAGTGALVDIGGDQTITGNKTFSGDVDLTGTFSIDGVEVTASAAEINRLVGVTGDVQTQINSNSVVIDTAYQAIGVALGETDLGTFPGSTIADNQTVKQALTALETSVETKAAGTDVTELTTNQNDLISLTGVAENDTTLGTFTGTTITDDQTIKEALQLLETSVESKGSTADLTNLTTAVGDLITLSGVAQNAEDLGTFTGGTIQDNRTVKEALQDLETELEDGAGSLTGDSGTADFASGTVTIAGGTGLTTTGAGSTLTVDLDDTTVVSGSYGNVNKSLTVSFDAQGRATFATSQDIEIVHTQVSDFDAGVQANTLDTMAQPVANVAMNNQRLTGLADPVGDQDAVTKSYADALVSGLDVKDSCRAATIANITLSGTQSIDGVNLAAGERVLVKDQTDAAQNGIYIVVDGGAWTRSPDADNSASGEVTSGMYVFIEEGSTNADAGFVLQTTGTIDLGVTDLHFVQFTGAGQISAGAGLSKTGNILDVGTASTDRIVVNANDIDLADHGTAGNYIGFTVDQYGRVSSFSTETTLAGYGITDAQPLDATLTALAGVTVAANELIYATGADTFAVTSFTAYARTLLDDADAPTARATLGLGTMAVQDANNVTISGGSIDNCTIDGGTF